MKISTKKLRMLIQETLDERSTTRRRATMVHEIRDMGGDLMSELWGKKEPQKRTSWEGSVANNLENAISLMSDGDDAVMRAVWGLNDDPPDAELLKLGQAFMKKLQSVAEEYRTRADKRGQE